MYAKRSTKLLTFALAALGCLGMSSAGAASEMDTLRVIAVRDLDFGRVVCGGPGRLTLDPRDSVLRSSDPGRLVILGGHASARFEVRGEPGRTVELVLPASIPIARSSLRIDDLMIAARDAVTAEILSLSGWQLTMPPSGLILIEVGGTLLVESDGAQQGSTAGFTLTASYLPEISGNPPTGGL
jgi:hypothetical protein